MLLGPVEEQVLTPCNRERKPNIHTRTTLPAQQISLTLQRSSASHILAILWVDLLLDDICKRNAPNQKLT